jgi:hypothetical protein
VETQEDPSLYLLLNPSINLSNCFRVSQGPALLSYHPIKAGVPQGNILAPLLYTVYTADIRGWVNKSVEKQTDGATSTVSGNCFHEAALPIQYAAKFQSDWSGCCVFLVHLKKKNLLVYKNGEN